MCRISNSLGNQTDGPCWWVHDLFGIFSGTLFWNHCFILGTWINNFGYYTTFWKSFENSGNLLSVSFLFCTSQPSRLWKSRQPSPCGRKVGALCEPEISLSAGPPVTYYFGPWTIWTSKTFLKSREGCTEKGKVNRPTQTNLGIKNKNIHSFIWYISHDILLGALLACCQSDPWWIYCSN